MSRSAHVALLGLLLAAILPAVARGETAAACPNCNVLLVTFDTLRADRLGAYGYEKPTTPALDSLAGRSSVFLDNSSQSGSTISSIPSMHTSKFPHTDRLLEDGKLRHSEETLAEILKKAGYETMAVIAHDYAGCKWQFCQGFDKTDEDFKLAEPGSETLRRVRAMLSTYGGDKPFFLWVHFRVPHTPYNPGPRLFEMFYDGDPEAPRFYQEGLADKFIRDQVKKLRTHYQKRGETALPYQAMGGALDLTPSLVAQIGVLYDGNVRSADDAFAELEADLSPDQRKRTVIVVASDHGESLGAHRLIGHNRLYQEVVQTPLIIHVPGRAAERVDAPTMNIDIVPTILAAIGQPIAANMRGIDLLTAPPPTERPQIAEYRVGQTIVHGPWKLLVRRDQPDVLYKLDEDPGETENLASEKPGVVARLKGELLQLRATTPAETLKRADTEVLQKLRALGYISDGAPGPDEPGDEGTAAD